MNRANVVAERYARALFTVAERRGEIFEALEHLRRLRETFRADARVSRFFHSPFVPLERKRMLVRTELARELIPPVRDFADLLLRKKRLDLLPSAVAEFEKQVRAWQGLQDAEAVSAVPLTADEVKRLHAELERLTGLTIELGTRVEPGLIGGMYVRIGDRVIDRSVKGLLETLRERLYETSLTGA